MEQLINRDFSSVSPSAKWMILWKGHTNIPFAKEVAELLEYPNKYIPDFKKRDFTFWASTLGLERRYWSIDQLLNDLTIKNILEISSGYSFRSLDYAQQKEVHYIDTDLPDVIATKKEFINSLKKNELNTNGKLELLPLNALDENSFHEIIGHFPQGEVAIVNEGLLGYLDKQEKEKLCSIIHDILMERGGYWITADIGLKNKDAKLGLKYNDEIKEFNEQQDTEGKSFESFKEAEMFFKEMGFVIDKEAKVKYSEMSSFKYLKRSITLRQFFKLRGAGKIQATWRLKAV
ncbi:MAG: class I SAM-dependent methyltransferase [Bacteroidia bacterium]|nr:class I SAM-dependent methyltransferase [Bacteroidia bacterium]